MGDGGLMGGTPGHEAPGPVHWHVAAFVVLRLILMAYAVAEVVAHAFYGTQSLN